jgi:A/G-specific adenine glycosylase
VRQFVRAIRRWSAQNQYTHPWRRTTDPFKILVAEVLLQLTPAARVTPVYRLLIKHFPTPKRLAEAPLESITDIIRPLGLINRAERLKIVAGCIVRQHGGTVPTSHRSLRRLKGVGQYTASAVRCFAFDRRVIILDANIVRILNRVFSLDLDVRKVASSQMVWNEMEQLKCLRQDRRTNWALLDFARTVCTAYQPKCVSCPVNSLCSFVKKRAIN